MPDGQDGEILTRGPELFTGYTDPALNAAAFLPGGWFRTGDIGRIDADGYLTVTDRLKDIIIRGGENISAKEVEDLLVTHPAVADVAVIPVPDPALGERLRGRRRPPGVHVRRRAGSGALRRGGAARQKTPEVIVLVDELPRTPSGKVRKDVLRAAEDGSERLAGQFCGSPTDGCRPASWPSTKVPNAESVCMLEPQVYAIPCAQNVLSGAPQDRAVQIPKLTMRVCFSAARQSLQRAPGSNAGPRACGTWSKPRRHRQARRRAVIQRAGVPQVGAVEHDYRSGRSNDLYLVWVRAHSRSERQHAGGRFPRPGASRG